MRPNAPILAVLALALTSLVPTTGHALLHLKKHGAAAKTPKSTHGKLSPEARRGLKEHKAHIAEAHRPHKAATAATRHTKSATADRVHAFVESQNQTVTSERAHTQSARLSQQTQHTRRHHRSSDVQTEDTAPRKATSADFLASAHVATSRSTPDAAQARVTGAGQADGISASQVPAGRLSAPTGDQRGGGEASMTEHSGGGAALEAALTPAQVAASQPPIATLDAVIPTQVAFHALLYNKRGRLIMPPPLKGSHEILIRQNQVADSEGLDRIRDDGDLDRMRTERLLVAIPTGNGMHVDDRLPVNRRYCRPWTALFLNQLGREFYARFQQPLQVNSAVRTVEFQHHLIHINGNAAPADGDTASPHLTGQAVDLAKHGLSPTEIAWLRGYLLPLVQQGKVDVEEEFQQSCFHISVYQKFLPHEPSMRRSIAETHRSGESVLATSLR